MDLSARSRRWVWFTAWLIVGAAYAFSFLTFAGLFILPIAILLTVLLAKTPSSSSGVPGLISGLGMPLLLIAYENREGPGTICHTTATAHTCGVESSPWPWLLLGVTLLTAGLLISLRNQRQGVTR